MHIVLLNGPSSAGKTSMAKQLQDMFDDNFVLIGLDYIIYTMPTRTNDYKADMNPRDGFYWIADVDAEGHPLMHLTAGAYGQKIYKTLIVQTTCFANQGLNVIVDHVGNIAPVADDHLPMTEYDCWKNYLRDHNVTFCGVTARPDILDQRERQRGDRVIGGSRAQATRVHDGYTYDIMIDTSDISPLEAAQKIYTFITKNNKKLS